MSLCSASGTSVICSSHTKNITTKRARTCHCRRTRRFLALSRPSGRRWPCQFWVGYTTNTFELEFPTRTGRPLMLSYDQAAAKMQWREAVRAVTEAIEDAGGIVNNVNDAKLDAVEAWIGESRRWLLDGLRLGRIDVAKANRAMCAADKLLYQIERVRERIRNI